MINNPQINSVITWKTNDNIILSGICIECTAKLYGQNVDPIYEGYNYTMQTFDDEIYEITYNDIIKYVNSNGYEKIIKY